MRCRDGTRLISRLWQPAGSGPWPALLMRQPYGRAIASTVTYAHPRWYAAQGFLVVVQDVRGRGDSSGDFAGFAQEAADGADCLRWLRGLPECNGRVGCYGFSYQGLTQLLSDDAGQLPDCLAPAMTGPDERWHWASSGGAHWWALGVGWGLQLASERCRRAGDAEGWQEIRRSLDTGGWASEGPRLLERHDPTGMALGWLRRDPADAAGWSCHAVPEALWRRPMLLIGGWHDPHLEGVLALWHGCRAGGGDPWLRIGAWSHLNWGRQLDELQAAFFRHHLQHQPATAELGCRTAVQDSRTGVWLELDPQLRRTEPGSSAAPAGAAAGAADCWRLAAPERLLPCSPSGSAGGEPGWIDLVHDPWRPVPGRGGHLGLDAGPCERADLDARNDVIGFTSPALERPLRLEGQPWLEVVAMADQPGFDLCLALSAVSPCGRRVHQLSTGVARHLGGDCLEPRRRRVVLQPLWTRLGPGERLRLSIAAAAWPQIAVNPGSGEPAWGGPSAGHRVITLSIRLSDARLHLLPLSAAAARADWGELAAPP
jgi:hypothetical protein